MNKKIALLRGINVGGKRRILMADLIVLFESFGFENIVTYIQSGNIIFDTKKKLTETELSSIIEKGISKKYGFDVPVIIRKSSHIEQAVLDNPFGKSEQIDIERLHFTFLKESPTEENVLHMQKYNLDSDRFIIKGKDVFIFCSGKYHQSQLTNNFFETKLKISATTRNWKTVLKLLALSKK